MKVKLLKKIRRRFNIHHCPHGIVDEGGRYEFNLFKLTDNNNSYFERYAQLGYNTSVSMQFVGDYFNTEKECIDFLKDLIVKKLRLEGYLGLKDKKIIKSSSKVWYK